MLTLEKTDLAVASLLHDQRTSNSQVSTTIREVINVLNDTDLDYGAKVRVLTKALMIINEEHRQFENTK